MVILTKLEQSYSFIGAGKRNLISGGSSQSIVGGNENLINNVTQAPASTGAHGNIIGGGYRNEITGVTEYNIIGGGSNNKSHDTIASFMGSGAKNTISGGAYTSVVGGHEHEIKDFQGSTIAGGSTNKITTYFKKNNAGTQPFQLVEQQVSSFIGNGDFNTISGASYSVIVGGSGNTINPASTTGATWNMGLGDGLSGVTSFIGTGFDNYISGATQSSILNGSHNIIKVGPISPDAGNPLIDLYARSFYGPARKDLQILGGDHNQILDYGPLYNLGYTTPRKSTIINGRHNIISGSNMSTIVNGKSNRINSGGWDYFGENTILNGSGNTIHHGTSASVILAGAQNTIVRVQSNTGIPVMGGSVSAYYNTIANGITNVISGVSHTTILNGDSNAITHGGYGQDGFVAILNGMGNDIGILGITPTKPMGGDMRFSTIVGGNQNRVQGWSRGTTIGGGQYNAVQGVGFGSFGKLQIYPPNPNLTASTGYDNYGTNNAFIGGGWRNTISGQSANAFIGAGLNNQIFSSRHSFIGTGQHHRIFGLPAEGLTASSANTIVTGLRNKISGNTTAAGIVSGERNEIIHLEGTFQRSAKSHYTFIGGGFKNKIKGSSWSSIVGGSGNTISAHTTGAGLPVSSAYSFIGGGSGSTIGSASGATILGGARNEILPFCSTFTYSWWYR